MASGNFFSIIIPAHNEEYYIGDTLEHVNALDYPHDKFEAVVIENGSDDATFQEAKNNESDIVTTISIPTKGISPARNAGIERMNSETDWAVFLDADTILSASFLKDLDVYLSRPGIKHYAVGAISMLPSNDSLTAKLWFKFYNLGHYLTKTPFGMIVIRKNVLKNERFDETLSMAEDLKMIGEARKLGSFFFFRTKTVATSTRRFEQVGWLKLFIMWTVVAQLPQSVQRRIKYAVIR